LNHEGKSKTLFNAGATDRNGELSILVPPSVPINLKLTLAGYQTWHYGDKTKATGAFRLKPEEQRNIKIELTPI